MDELLQKLCEKMERIEANQELILERLSDSIIYPNTLRNKRPAKSKKERNQDQNDEIKAILINGPLLREKFNLATTPQSPRILAYLKTNDPSVFDGLKRNV